METNSAILGYIPNVVVFEYTKSSKCRWWLNYRLPNGDRIRRPCSNKKSEAVRNARIKQGQLANGNFDELDRKRLGNFLQEEEKLTLDEALPLYLELTVDDKKKRSLRKDKGDINRAFEFFKKKGCVYLEDVSPVHCSKLIAHLKEKKRSSSTLKNYHMAVSKMFRKLRKMKVVKLDNPMEDVSLPKQGKKYVRDRLPSPQEIKALLDVQPFQLGHSSNRTPIREIARFAIVTGARIGEILHSEWGDFDFERGIWHIREKPDCPSVEGMGWGPKWGKERSIPLLPEALRILHLMPRHETVGIIKDEQGNKRSIPAGFVFPKMQVRILPSCLMSVHSRVGAYKCRKCSLVPDRTQCSYRQVTYSRCDDIGRSWENLCKLAGVENLHVHDIRRYFNIYVLQERYGLTPQQAGWYIGNSEEVNKQHYSPIPEELLMMKIQHNNVHAITHNGNMSYTQTNQNPLSYSLEWGESISSVSTHM